MRPDDKRKNCAKKISARADCCSDATGQQKKVCCAATEKAAQKKISVLPALEHGCGKKNLHGVLTRLLGCDKKIISARPAALTLLRGSDKKIFSLMRGRHSFCRSDRSQKVTARAVKTEQTATGHKKAARTALERGCDKKNFCMAP
jgi:hypothetical protein